jgi:N-terminal half of MaoC dehydratase
VAEHFEITDAMRAAIGVESDGWPVEFTSTGIRAFARGVGIDDIVYYDVAAAQAAGYANLPAPPTYAGVPIFLPGVSDPVYGLPSRSSTPRLGHGLPNILDGGTEYLYDKVPTAGETLITRSRIIDLEVKESKSLGKMLVVTSEATYVDADSGETYFRTRSQMIAY